MKKIIYGAGIIISVVIIFLVSLHSVQEIHYLKSFYPSQFTVEEAMYASVVELVKVVLIAIPLVVIIALFQRLRKKQP